MTQVKTNDGFGYQEDRLLQGKLLYSSFDYAGLESDDASHLDSTAKGHLFIMRVYSERSKTIPTSPSP
jgi:hypothetical protein